MIGTTLEDIRDHVERLATDDGDYYLVCARYGDRPVPAAGLRFADRPTARAAARATEQYRAALRRYDPGVPRYDVIVSQLCEPPERPDRLDLPDRPERSDRPDHPDRRSDRGSGRSESRTGGCGGHGGGGRHGGIDEHDAASGRGGSDEDDEDRWALSEPVINGRSRRNERRRRLVEFCHRIAAAVFEALSEAGCREVETAVMDRYFDLAERVPDPDALCLCLLEGMAAELADRLAAEDLTDILSRAADRLERSSVDGFDDADRGTAGIDVVRPADGAGGPADTPDDEDAADPLSATLGDLRDHGLLAGFDRVPAATEPLDLDDGTGSFAETARITGYALSPRNGSLPVLPIVVEFIRRSPERRPTGTRVEPTDDGWTMRVEFEGDANDDSDDVPKGLVTAPIRSPEP
ncbi:DUF7551 domain-containing protein [Halorubrum aethiopicum]|uniref:DUF7551 domain-containing protein n=1 Tax=Halorubrum aethiopicum TaxID=1758255 RepID=UPI00082CFA47|nr:hypothetical protein [Halorubrum aethiopicum]